jgi:hypothetical protein
VFDLSLPELNSRILVPSFPDLACELTELGQRMTEFPVDPMLFKAISADNAKVLGSTTRAGEGAPKEKVDFRRPCCCTALAAHRRWCPQAVNVVRRN